MVKMRNSSSPSRFITSRILFEANNGAGGGSGNPDPNDDKGTKPKQSDIEDAVNRRISELLGVKSVNNDPMAALTISIKAQHRLEQEVDRLKSQVGQAPADVTAKLAKYEALGTPEELTTRLSAGDEAITTATQLQREKAIGDAAGVLQLKPNALLRNLLKDVELRVEGEGENAKVLVKDGDTEKPFDDYAKGRADLQDALPALTVEARPNGTRMVPLNGATGTKANKFDAIREEVKARNEAQKPEPRDLSRAGIH
jgi:hypothetical protein